jgi:hypothetical protein
VTLLLGSTGLADIAEFPEGLLPNPRDPGLHSSKWFHLRSPGRDKLHPTEEVTYDAVSLARAHAVANILLGNFEKLTRIDLAKYVEVVECQAKRAVLLDYMIDDHLKQGQREGALFEFLARARYLSVDAASAEQLVAQILEELRSVPADAIMRNVKGRIAVAAARKLACDRRDGLLARLRQAWQQEYEPEVKFEIAEVIQGIVVDTHFAGALGCT